jgi:Ca2+-transporting ATPase
LSGLFQLVLANHDRWFRRRERRNPRLKWMLAGVALVLTAVLGIPALRTLMGLAWPNAATVTAIAAVVLAMSAWIAALRAGARVLRPRRTAGVT